MRRYFFDHLAKTAGTAIHRFLRNALGEHRVTPQVIGEHRELISRYGNYDIITAHVIFKPGATLDPNRAYFTILREPLDRALSWLYFVSHDVAETEEIGGQRQAARKFLASDGDTWSPLLDEALREPYLRHFSRLSNESCTVSRASKIDLALQALNTYGLVGIYNCLGFFLDDLCNELGLQRQSLPVANATTNRPKVDEISQSLRNRLEELTSADQELFHAAKLLFTQKSIVNKTSSADRIVGYSGKHFEIRTEVNKDAVPPWNRCVPENAVEIVSSSVIRRDDALGVITPGAWARFAFHLHLHLNVRNLLVGIQLYEDSGREIFGTNNNLLGRKFKNIATDQVVVQFDVRLNLSPGSYVAGLAIYDSKVDGANDLLGWWDRLFDFEIHRCPRDFVGITRLDSDVHVTALPCDITCCDDEGNLKVQMG
jgi:Wzt C-terminal domain/Sulfotransferase family